MSENKNIYVSIVRIHVKHLVMLSGAGLIEDKKYQPSSDPAANCVDILLIA
jgi:hypothetical protein